MRRIFGSSRWEDLTWRYKSGLCDQPDESDLLPSRFALLVISHVLIFNS